MEIALIIWLGFMAVMSFVFLMSNARRSTTIPEALFGVFFNAVLFAGDLFFFIYRCFKY